MQEITIVGAGLSGLIAAIQLAEQGARVVLHEAGAKPGGRARTDSSLRRVNLGPHAIYRRGAFGRWLTENDLLPPVHFPSLRPAHSQRQAHPAHGRGTSPGDAERKSPSAHRRELPQLGDPGV
ncbi:MAG: NAD(P)-binding protein [Deltaproteobacteria bacterium]|nr:NAD(P)-binding protein [Deltaproteobacteria bacterium]